MSARPLVPRARCALALATAILAACDGAKSPTAAHATERAAPAAAVATASDVNLLAALQLPVAQVGSTASPAALFKLTQIGTGPNALFTTDNTGNASPTLQATNIGTGPAIFGKAAGKGRAGFFQITYSANSSTALAVSTVGSGPALQASTSGARSAGQFIVSNSNNGNPALSTVTNGTGSALSALTTGTGRAGYFQVSNTAGHSSAIEAQTNGSGGQVLLATAHGKSTAGHFSALNSGNILPALSSTTFGTGPAFQAVNNSTGWAGRFTAQAGGKGVYIRTNGGQGLLVEGGAKSALVQTPSGARALYTEESSEVWFTDYGFGRLTDGRARVLLDPAFAQTVNAGEPYHVFVEEYGRAELYVAERTPLGFVVELKDGDPNVEFGYRVVARRLGFERTRLELAP